MRKNKFGEYYAHTAQELRNVLLGEDVDVSEVSADSSRLEPTPADEVIEGQKAVQVEIRTDEEGDTVCFVETDTPEEARAILAEVGVTLT